MLPSSPTGSFFERVHAVVRQIPPGKVTTYGQVAAAAGNPRAARMVGWALHAASPAHRLPWQRVINRHGEISLRHDPQAGRRQRVLLEREGIVFDTRDRIDLARYGWHPGPATRAPRGSGVTQRQNARLPRKTGVPTHPARDD